MHGTAPARRPRPGFRRGPAAVFHALALASLLAVQFHAGIVPSADMVELWYDENYYVTYAVNVFHDFRFTSFENEQTVPLYPVWLAALMHVDPAFYDFLECVHSKVHLPAVQVEAICRPLGNIGYHAQAALGAVGVALAWLAGRIASGRLAVAHLSALVAIAAGQYAVDTTSFLTEVLVVPLLAGVNVCLAWLLAGEGAPRRNAIVATGCGVALGALVLVRPPYEWLLPALLLAGGALILRNRRRRRARAVALACILGAASAVVAPWLVHNHRTQGFTGLTSGYAPVILSERLVHNGMSARQWAAAFLYWTPGADLKLLARLFGEETDRYFHGLLEREKAASAEMRAKVVAGAAPEEDLLAPLMARVRDNLPEHLAASAPLAWHGMQPWNRAGERAVLRPSFLPDPWFGVACWSLLVIGLVRGSRRNRRVLLALAFCPAVVLALNALVSASAFRYNIGLVTPLSVGVALSVVRLVDSARNGLRRGARTGRPASARAVAGRAAEGGGGPIDASRSRQSPERGP